MKQICTQIAIICLLAISQNVKAQSISVSNSNPYPTPAFNTPVGVSQANGFESTNKNAFNEFPNNKQTTITSPYYSYSTPQSILYFQFNFDIASSNTYPATITLFYGSPEQSISFNTSINFIKNAGTYYFIIDPGFTLPAFTNFKLQMTMTSTSNTVRATTFATNANSSIANAPIPLPVKLASFQGALNKNKVDLTWLVADNQTAKSFEVQRSTNGTDFTTAAVIPASKKSGNENYSFTETVSSARVLYRLKMYDVDAKAEYSKTLAFNSSSTAAKSLQVLTNPVKEKLVISFTSESSEIAQVNIYDNAGRVMQRQALTASQGINTNTIALNGNYRSGLYIVELVTKSGRLVEKIIYSNQ